MDPASLTDTVIFWPFLVYFGAVLVVVAGMIGMGYVLGERHRGRVTDEPFESGMIPTDSARVRLSPKFYLVAMIFVIFDLEVVFIIAWAIAFREVGWVGYIGVLFFIAVLVVALVYEWREGALDWAGKKKATMRHLAQREQAVRPVKTPVGNEAGSRAKVGRESTVL